MTYTIETIDSSFTPEFIQLGSIPAQLAMAEAHKAAAKHTDQQVFLTFFRRSDGQRGYLNSDGNHDITGRAY